MSGSLVNLTFGIDLVNMSQIKSHHQIGSKCLISKF